MLALFLASPVPAAARVIGVYVAPRVLVGEQDTGELSKDWERDNISRFSRTVAGGALAVGYNFAARLRVPVRVELEVAARGAAGKSKEGVDASGMRWKSKYTMNLTTLFWNVYYDIYTGTPFTPYVGAGLGWAINSSQIDEDFSSSTVYGHARADSLTVALAGNLGAGVSWSFSERIAVDLGYRYIAAGHHEAKFTFDNIPTTKEFTISSNPYIHEVHLGARITF
jgi:opacity protein-like surface antigen